MSSIKGQKEKSSSKFWKKFSLNKKTSVTLPEQQQPSAAIHDNDDDRSVKSKRLSGFLHKRQSIGSLRKRQSSSNNNYQQQQMPPAIPDHHAMNQQQQQQQQQLRQQQLSSQSPSLTDSSAATVTLLAKESSSASRDLGSTADSPAPSVDNTISVASVDKKEYPQQPHLQQSNELTPATTSTSVESNATVSRLKSPDTRSNRPRYNSNTTSKPPASRLAAPSTTTSTFPPKNTSTSTGPQPHTSNSSVAHHNNSSSDRLPRPTLNKSTCSIRSTSSSSSPSSSPSSSSRTNHTPPSNKSTGNGNSSRLRKPSQIPNKSALSQLRGQEATVKNNKNDQNNTLLVKKKKSGASIASNSRETPNVKSSKSTDTSEKSDHEQIILQLREELEKERSVVKVLQGQKEAVAKDLDYFSQMMDELMEEKEQLQQKYEEEKENNRHREQDLNELLNKLKSSNENARDRSFEADQWKMDLEKIRDEAREEQEGLKSQVKSKNQEIKRLRSELSHANEQIETLKTTMDQLIQTQYAAVSNKECGTNDHHTNNSPQPIETPTASPNIQHANLSLNHPYTVQDNTLPHDVQSPIPTSYNNTSMPPSPTTTQYQTTSSSIPIKNNLYHDYEKNSAYNTPQSSFNSQATATTAPNDVLDRQLLKLTKEKEKLQSDYSKIPLSGGGPMSRRRKEELEDMLDEIDSQLSKVKQKIKRS